MMVVLEGNYFQVNFKITVNKGSQKIDLVTIKLQIFPN